MLNKRSLLAISFVTVAVGFLVGFWPLCILGILIAAVSGRWVSAVLLGLLLDVAYGIPVGLLHGLYFPFTLLAVVSTASRTLLVSRLRKGERDTV